jgi:hypothetical protein
LVLAYQGNFLQNSEKNFPLRPSPRNIGFFDWRRTFEKVSLIVKKVRERNRILKRRGYPESLRNKFHPGFEHQKGHEKDTSLLFRLPSRTKEGNFPDRISKKVWDARSRSHLTRKNGIRRKRKNDHDTKHSHAWHGHAGGGEYPLVVTAQ